MIERLYPGVFVVEVASNPKPIDGVWTSASAESRHPGVFVTQVPSGVKPIEGVSPSTGTESPHPGVFVTEVPFNARPIDGVSTSSTAADVAARVPRPPAPGWTDQNQHDPGITLLQLLSYSIESLLYHGGPVGDVARHARASWGVAAGLAVGSDSDHAHRVSASPGSAIAPDGRGVASDASVAVRREPDP
jgi:hypothetical protein